MKRFAIAAALLVCAFAVPQEAAAAPHVRVFGGVGFGSSGVHLNIGGAWNQRYVAAGQAWVNEPYIWYQNIPDATTGRIVRVPRIGYVRRLVVLYLDTWTGTYFYLDRFGSPVPWNRYGF